MKVSFRAGLLLALSACNRAPEAVRVTHVDASAYDAFYLWPGVRPSPDLQIKTLYLLDGEIRRSGPSHFERLRMGSPHLPGKTLWMVVRADRLDWDEGSYATILTDLRQWQNAGNQVVGLQVDFDAATRGIGGYAGFLRELRTRLPSTWRLSVTGLMDWSAHGDPEDLVKLSGIVDEVVIQTYQGKTTIPGYEAYFRRMDRYPIPFRVALVENGAWEPPRALVRHPRFRGYVIFLLKSDHASQASESADRAVGPR